MDGSLNAQLGKGHHQIQISRLDSDSMVQVVHGSLVLRIPEECTFGIRIHARSITLPERMAGVMIDPHTQAQRFEYPPRSSTESIIEIDATNSQVVVEHQDWMSSLGLGWTK